MRAVLTRVKNASVSIDGELVSAIGKGFLVLLGVHVDDTEAEAEKIADRICGLRIFEDENGKMNKSISDVGGELLVVSQFTLAADTSRGLRPSFTPAAAPDVGERLYEHFVSAVRQSPLKVETGEFGAHMQVGLVNDGPVTIWLEV